RYVLSFALGAGPVPCLLMSEILPGKIRAKAMAICLAVHWWSSRTPLSKYWGRSICSTIQDWQHRT
ncbi:putative plastidic glucose transporter 3-like protein, partial [Trifolium pratense]